MDDQQEQALARRRLLGWGPALEPIAETEGLGRDVRFAVGANGRDLVTTEGITNLGQALTVALTTPLGGDVFNTQFGFDGIRAMVEETIPVLVQERIRVALVTLLRKDPRISRIVDIQLQDGRLSAPAAGNRELDVRVVFETITGERATLDLGQVVFSD
jgi:phage baseplate assembly protein W